MASVNYFIENRPDFICCWLMDFKWIGWEELQIVFEDIVFANDCFGSYSIPYLHSVEFYSSYVK